MVHLNTVDMGSLGHYDTFDTLICDGSLAPWIINSDTIVEKLKSMCSEGKLVITDDYVDTLEGAMRPGVRHRALVRFTSRHYDLRTLAMTTASLNSRVSRQVIIFRISATPSLKCAEYLIYLIFDAAVGTFMSSPISRCGCPVGRQFCSRMLGFLLLLGTIQ